MIPQDPANFHIPGDRCRLIGNPEEGVGDLIIYRDEDTAMNRSVWLPSPDELEALNNGGFVLLQVNAPGILPFPTSVDVWIRVNIEVTGDIR